MRRDSRYSWVMACSCSMVVFCTLGMFRTSGLFYLELQDVFAVSREAAVWPIGIAGFGLSLFASLPGFLIAFFTLRQILFTGITLVISGLALCFFATSTTSFTVFYGIIFATGCGLCVPTSSILMNGHFVKYRGIANSILFSGDSLALFLMTPLTTFLLKTYELRGACLIIAAIFANLYVLLKIMRPFQGTIAPPAPKIFTNGIQNGGNHINDIKTTLLQSNIPNKLVENTPKPTLKEKFMGVLRTYWKVFKDPMYQICTTTQAFYSVVVVIYCIVIADYGLDQGMEKFNAVYLITVTGASELVGRATVGYITDHNFIKPKTVSAMNQILVAVILVVQTFVGNAPFLHFILSCLFGLLSGCVYALGNVIYVQYLGIERLGTALSLKSFLIAILAFLRPVLIALCRDGYGTYVYLFYILAVISLLFGLSWVFEPHIMKRRRNKANDKQLQVPQLIEDKL